MFFYKKTIRNLVKENNQEIEKIKNLNKLECNSLLEQRKV